MDGALTVGALGGRLGGANCVVQVGPFVSAPFTALIEFAAVVPMPSFNPTAR